MSTKLISFSNVGQSENFCRRKLFLQSWKEGSKERWCFIYCKDLWKEQKIYILHFIAELSWKKNSLQTFVNFFFFFPYPTLGTSNSNKKFKQGHLIFRSWTILELKLSLLETEKEGENLLCLDSVRNRYWTCANIKQLEMEILTRTKKNKIYWDPRNLHILYLRLFSSFWSCDLFCFRVFVLTHLSKTLQTCVLLIAFKFNFFWV